MFCSPDGATYTPVIGRQIQLVSQNSWGPGAFGFLDLPIDPDGPCNGNQGAAAFRCAVGATQNVTQCVTQRGVDIRPGRLAGAASSGLNVRFDMYDTNLKSKSDDPLYAPAPNVVKGIGPKSN